jgi:CheY-like chemotaxis protein
MVLRRSKPAHSQCLNSNCPGAELEMNGCEVARHIRQDKEQGNVQLIALSGWGQRQDRERSRACGFDHHLTKPAELDSLLRILSGS